MLRPPNHQLVPVTIVDVSDPDGDPLTITATRIRQDEPRNGFADGNTCPDATGVGTTAAMVRAERSRWLDGRVYHVSFVADDGRGGRCDGTVTVCVPDGPFGCWDEGPLFDSTGPCQ